MCCTHQSHLKLFLITVGLDAKCLSRECLCGRRESRVTLYAASEANGMMSRCYCSHKMKLRRRWNEIEPSENEENNVKE